MKLVVKILLLGAIALPVGTSAVIYSIEHKNDNNDVMRDPDIHNDGDYIVMSDYGYELKLDRYNLGFEITKGGKTWKSGQLDPSELDDEGYGTITSGYMEAFFKSPITIYYGDGDTYYSIVDETSLTYLYVRTKSFSFETSNNEIVAKVNTGYGKKATELSVSISFNIHYQILEDGLRIYLSDIVEGEATNKVTKIAIYPGFGMSYMQNDEKFLIPDGSGAIIDLSKPSSAKKALTLKVYGEDIGLGFSTRTYYSSEQLSMPMYAAYDNEKALITTIYEGEEHADLYARTSSNSHEVNNMYNYIHYIFALRDSYPQYYGVGEKDYTNIIHENIYDYHPGIEYHLYDESLEYYDIAKKYQEYLVNNGLLIKSTNLDNRLRLEFLMAENKKALFGNELVKMTSVSYIKDKMEELKEVGNEFSVSLRGYTQGGFNGSYPYTFPIESQTGSAGQYKDLATSLSNRNIDVNYNVDLVRSFKKDLKKNALNESQKIISSKDYVNGTRIDFYRINPNETVNLINKYDNQLSSNHGTGLDFTSIGYELFSTYFRERNTREQAREKYISAMKEFTHLRNVRKPNQYMYQAFDRYLDTPTSSSNFIIENESIPFLQMVLSGYKTFASSPINLNYLGEKQLLELVDYNVSPSFLLTEKDTMNLIDSPASSYIYSSVYDVWKNDIINSYNKVINVLNQVNGQEFIKREVIDNNIIKNTYENKCIVINYSSNPYVYQGTEIAPLSSGVFDL